MLQGSKLLAGFRSRNLVLIVSQEEQNINLFFNSDIMNYLLNPMGGETKDLICFLFFLLLFFCSLECFKCRWVDGGGVEQKVLFRAG